MIDFRYHIVSLVAVFLALAVGVILGAGPLRGQLSDTLERQVTELGDERSELRSQVAHQEGLAQDKDAIIDSLTAGAVADVLTGTDVTVVELPGADSDLADEMATVLATAGSGLLSRTQVLDLYEAPDEAPAREEVLDDVESLVGTSTDLAGAVAAAVVGVGPDGTEIEAGAVGTQLQQADVLAVTGTGDATDLLLPGTVDVGTPDLVVVVAGGLEGEDVSDPDTVARLQSRVELVTALSAADTPVLVVGAGSETWADPQVAAQDSLVAQVRADADLADVVSTTDNAESDSGRLIAAWTAAWLVAGEVGHYGAAEDADEPAPPPPPALGAAEEDLPGGADNP